MGILFFGNTASGAKVTLEKTFDNGFNCFRYVLKIDNVFLHTVIQKHYKVIFNHFLELTTNS